MEFTEKQELTQLSLQMNFNEPLVELTKEDQRMSLVSSLSREFKIKLNDIKVNASQLSNNWIHFSRLYGLAWFDVSFGLEEISALIQGPQNEGLVKDLYSKLTQFFKEANVDSQVMMIQQHFSTEGDVNTFLRSLNPTIPTNFEKLLGGNGVFYSLKMPDHNLTIFITVVNSLPVPGGLYISVENVFSPTLHGFQETFTVAKERYEFIMNELDITLKEA